MANTQLKLDVSRVKQEYLSNCHSEHTLLKEPEKVIRKVKSNSMTFTINTNKLCLICLKDCETSCVKKSRQLCRILTRYFGVNLMVPALVLQLQSKGLSVSSSSENYQNSAERVQFPICENCSALTNTLNELFLELELAQMKLNQYGQNLSDIMKIAGKVPCRLYRLNELLPVSLDKPQGIARKIMDSARKEVWQKCSQRKKKDISPSIVTLPTTMKIALKREPVLLENENIENTFSLLNTPSFSSSSTSHVTSYQQQQQNSFTCPDSEEDVLALLGCTLSLWLVFLLALLDVDQLVKIKSREGNEISAFNYMIVPYEPEKEEINRKCENKMHSPPPDIKPILPCHGMNLRKRKIKIEFDEVQIKGKRRSKRIAAKAIQLPNYDESSDEVSDEEIRQKEIEGLSTRNMKKRKNRNCSSTYEDIQLSSVITPEQATNAVKTIQIPKPQSQMKTLHVKEECEVQLRFSGAKEDHFFPSSTCPVEEPVLQPAAQTCLSSPQVTIFEVPPVAIDFVELGQGHNDSSNSPLFHALAFPITKRVSSGYTCFVCDQHFESRAKIEKHRAVLHKLKNYVECPTCFHMFSSYFDLELHRKNEQMCRIDESMKQHEMMDIARPIFPSETCIIGSNFCPYPDCCEVFENATKLNLHLKAHGRFQCRFGCCQLFGKAHELAAHEIRNHQYGVPPPNSCKCPRCDYVTVQEDGYIAHFLDEHLNISSKLLLDKWRFGEGVEQKLLNMIPTMVQS